MPTLSSSVAVPIAFFVASRNLVPKMGILFNVLPQGFNEGVGIQLEREKINIWRR